MIGEERGFTLAETVTAMLVFGILLTAALPAAVEVNHHLVSGNRRLEAMGLAESKMEEVQRVAPQLAAKGSSTAKNGGARYRLRWRTERIGGSLTGSEVEVEWKDSRGRGRHLVLKSLRYRP